MSDSVPTAARLGLLACHLCGLVSRRPGSDGQPYCPRCGTPLHSRKRHSVSRTWALLVAATILYIPANVLPVTVTATLLGTQEDTILSGVVFLWTSGSRPIAALLFFASVMVPVLKILSLSLLLFTVQRRSVARPRDRARLYRLVELVGRWSMVDVFVVTLLAALVQLPTLATIQVGPGAMAFAAVVVLTMVATESFDPRLIWDAVEDTDD